MARWLETEPATHGATMRFDPLEHPRLSGFQRRLASSSPQFPSKATSSHPLERASPPLKLLRDALKRREIRQSFHPQASVFVLPRTVSIQAALNPAAARQFRLVKQHSGPTSATFSGASHSVDDPPTTSGCSARVPICSTLPVTAGQTADTKASRLFILVSAADGPPEEPA